MFKKIEIRSNDGYKCFMPENDYLLQLALINDRIPIPKEAQIKKFSFFGCVVFGFLMYLFFII